VGAGTQPLGRAEPGAQVRHWRHDLRAVRSADHRGQQPVR
jgi:hypothetical protein